MFLGHIVIMDDVITPFLRASLWNLNFSELRFQVR